MLRHESEIIEVGKGKKTYRGKNCGCIQRNLMEQDKFVDFVEDFASIEFNKTLL